MNTKVRTMVILVIFMILATLGCGGGQPLGAKFPVGDFQCTIPLALQGATNLVILNFSITPEQKIGNWTIFDAGTRTISVGAGFGESKINGNSVQFTLQDNSSGAHVLYKINGTFVAPNKMSGDYSFDYGDRYGIVAGKFECDLASSEEKTAQSAKSTQPISTPTQPISTSTQPISTPTQPISTSTQPISTPTQPIPTLTPVATPTPAYPTYAEIVKTYPASTELSCTDVEVSEVTPDGKLVLTGGLLCPGKSRLTVDAGTTFTISESQLIFGAPWKSYGAKITVVKTITLDGVIYQPGSKLTVDKDLHWIQVSNDTGEGNPSIATPAAVSTQPAPAPTQPVSTPTQPASTPTQPPPTSTQVPPIPTTARTSLQSGIPVIQSVVLRKDRSSGELVIYQDVYFTDSDGDVTGADYKIISTTNPDVQVAGGAINISSEAQKVGAFFTGKWGCGGGNYTITLSVTLTDKAGNQSAPYDYTMVCD